MKSIRGLPTEDGHGDAVGAVEPAFELQLKIMEGIELQEVVEPLLIVSMASLDLTVVPRRSRTKDVMNDTVLIAKHVKGMDTLRFGSMCKLSALIRLDLLRCITEILDRSLNEVNGGITAVFFVSIQKSLAGRFFNDRILIVLLYFFSSAAGGRNVFDVHLPLFSQNRRRIVLAGVLRFLLGRFCRLTVTEPGKHTIQRSGMP